MRGGSLPRRCMHIIFLMSMLAMRMLALISCASTQTNTVSISQSPITATPPAASSQRYIDGKLGFHLDLPTGWTARSVPGLREPLHFSAVTLVSQDETRSHGLVQVGALEGSVMPA